MRKKKVSEFKVQNAENVEYSGHQELQATEMGLIGYSTDIVVNLAKKMNISSEDSGNMSVLEFGAGSGFLADIWRNEIGITPDCCEIDPSLVESIKARGLTCFTSLNELPKKYNAIYTSNVLEHIEDDRGAISLIFNSLTSPGVIGIYVPAFPILFSGMDIAVGHVRRYRRRELMIKVKASGFEIESCTYADFIGFFASFALKILGFKGKANLGSTQSLKFYDSWIYPISRFLDLIGFRYVAGKNLILIARKRS